jgi:GNAT superfamily N-acetyltransferase
MLNIVFANAWQSGDWKLQADAKAFWAKLNLISPEERERRASELCAVAYVDGKVAGVSTVTINMVPSVRQKIAMYRCAVDPDFRRQDVAERISGYTRQVMETWAADNPQEKVLGFGAIIQAAELQRKGLEPIWHDWGVDLVLTGYTQRGEQIRIGWFRHVRLDPPIPAQNAAGPEGVVQ